MAVGGISFITSKLHNILSSSSSTSSIYCSTIPPLHNTPNIIANEPPTQTHPQNDWLRSNSSTKRQFNMSIVALVTMSIPTFIHNISNNANAKQEKEEKETELELERYIDYKNGFTLLIPHSWIKVDKAGATLLFQEPDKSANNVGVVVSPVRLSKLEEFGTPEFVADKLIQAEKRKDYPKSMLYS